MSDLLIENEELKKELAKTKKHNELLVQVSKDLRDWVDAVPQDTVLPAMPGVDRDWVDSVIDGHIEEDEDE